MRLLGVLLVLAHSEALTPKNSPADSTEVHLRRAELQVIAKHGAGSSSPGSSGEEHKTVKEEKFSNRIFPGGLEAMVPAWLSSGELAGHNALESVHGLALHVIMPVAALFLLCILLGHWLTMWKYSALIPNSVWTVMFSALFGLFVRVHLFGAITSKGYVWVSASALNLFLLPIIIFQSGWVLNHRNFISQIEHILVFAVFGTLVCFGLQGFGGYFLGVRGWHVLDDLRENLVFAALISAVDPVATLATFSKLGLDSSQPLLHTMIFGESVINDAVAIVLFHTINSVHFADATITSCAMDISRLLFGSAILGCLVAAALVVLLRVARLPGHTIAETLYIAGSAWFVYALAEGMGFSGIIANLCSGCIFRAYGGQHLEDKGLEMTSNFLEVTAHVADTMVFMICGASTAMIESFRGAQFALIGFILSHVGRAISTHLCTVSTNAIKWCVDAPQEQYLNSKHEVMMWHAGLRGGIAITLALEIDATWCHHKATIINATFIIICVNLLLLGSTTETMLRLLGFSSAEAPDSESLEDAELHHGHHALNPESVLMDQILAHPGRAMSTKVRLFGAMSQWCTYLLVGDHEAGSAMRKEKAQFLANLRNPCSNGTSTASCALSSGSVTCRNFGRTPG